MTVLVSMNAEYYKVMKDKECADISPFPSNINIKALRKLWKFNESEVIQVSELDRRIWMNCPPRSDCPLREFTTD